MMIRMQFETHQKYVSLVPCLTTWTAMSVTWPFEHRVVLSALGRVTH